MRSTGGRSKVMRAAGSGILAVVLCIGAGPAWTSVETTRLTCDAGDAACVMWTELRRFDGKVRFSLQLSEALPVNVARKTYAGRVVIDITGATLPDTPIVPSSGTGVVTGIRTANHEQRARIVLDVSNPAAARQAEVLSDGEGWLRVVLDEDAIDDLLDEPVVFDPPAPKALDARDAHDRAIALVREDDLDGALAIIAEARGRYPDAVGLIVDEIVMFNWAGRHEEALAHAATMAEVTMPPFAYKALGRSARSLGRYETAEFWFRRARRAEPDDPAAVAGLAISLADLGLVGEARDLLEKVADSTRDSSVYWMASAYVHESAGEPLAAVLDYDAALARDPDDPKASKARQLALQALLRSDTLSLD